MTTLIQSKRTGRYLGNKMIEPAGRSAAHEFVENAADAVRFENYRDAEGYIWHIMAAAIGGQWYIDVRSNLIIVSE